MQFCFSFAFYKCEINDKLEHNPIRRDISVIGF